MFYHALYQFQTWYIPLVDSATHRFRVSSQWDHSDLIYSQERVKAIFPHK